MNTTTEAVVKPTPDLKTVMSKMPSDEYLSELVPMLLEQDHGDLLSLKPFAFMVVDNEAKVIQPITFDEYLSFGFKRVFTKPSLGRQIQREVWEELFKMKAPDQILAISKAALQDKSFHEQKSLLARNIAMMSMPEIDWSENYHIVLAASLRHLNPAGPSLGTRLYQTLVRPETVEKLTREKVASNLVEQSRREEHEKSTAKSAGENAQQTT